MSRLGGLIAIGDGEKIEDHPLLQRVVMAKGKIGIVCEAFRSANGMCKRGGVEHGGYVHACMHVVVDRCRFELIDILLLLAFPVRALLVCFPLLARLFSSSSCS